jgi:hypothetical protein
MVPHAEPATGVERFEVAIPDARIAATSSSRFTVPHGMGYVGELGAEVHREPAQAGSFAAMRRATFGVVEWDAELRRLLTGFRVRVSSRHQVDRIPTLARLPAPAAATTSARW